MFEWQINETVTNFSSDYQVHIVPSPWITRLNDSLDDKSYISLGKIYVSKDGISCSDEDLNFIVRRSQSDETLEYRVQRLTEKKSPWLYLWGARLMILTVIYIWWSTIFNQRRSVLNAIIFTVIIGIFYVGLTQVVRPLLPRIVDFHYLGSLDCDQGTITFNAGLSRIHYETLIVFFVGILLELGAIGVMVQQIIRAVMGRKKIPNQRPIL
jgi:hypothetical protein